MIIYKVTNLINNKIYIGQTKHQLEYRKNQHLRETKSKKDDMYFHRALLKYGFENFNWEQIDIANSLDELNQKEIYYIQLFNTTNRDFGYNRKLGGEQGQCSEETKQLIGSFTKERWKNPNIAAKMLAGLRKGTETVKANSKGDTLHECTCKICHIKFFHVNKTTKTCSKDCLTLLRKQSASIITAINKCKNDYRAKQKVKYEQSCQYIIENKHLQIYKIINNLLLLNDIKDKRTLYKLLQLNSLKELKQFIKNFN